ncbi:hypothetical protein psyc5s11_50810 [Clostridium gelidum]|uniref:Dolichyl-phosphate mannose synthase n=1 Tax=Clostridium gelidum TaxID=704125 RepID=A0ABM7TLR7_9CLOT|nr:dolichyl-phosphate mannose synthase [Clostridium gelidum]BCZ49014.1 hypothetical protein psyc5s11_50810 [Clostridium gelidum]
MGKIHLIMPMGGRGSRFVEYGYAFPKPLIELNEFPFFFWATQSIRKFVELASLDFVVLKEHVEKYEIDKKIISYFPEANIHIIPEVLDGAVLTCMEGIFDISDDMPILFNDCDHLFRSIAFNDFCLKGQFDYADGALLTFKSDEPKYSFLKYGENENVTQTVEKVAISKDAICGAYYFKKKSIFINAVEKYLNNCKYDEYFVSGVYNIMADEGQCIKGFATDYHIPFGVPDEYEIAKRTDRFGELLV